jgi:hypothetical protein
MTAMSSSELRIVNFDGDKIVTFEYEGTRYVAMRRIVENLSLDWAGQHHKLVAQSKKFCVENISTRDTLGREQQMLSVPVGKFPLWLASLNPNKIRNEDVRAKVERYQAESAIALYDYWTKGVAVKGDKDGIVTGIDPAIMQAIGGMVKGIVHKQMASIIPDLIRAELSDGRLGVVRGHMSVGEILEEMGKVRGVRGLVTKVSGSIRRFCANRGVAPLTQRAGKAWCYVYPETEAREWFEREGRSLIAEYQRSKGKQLSLRLVGSAP